MREKLGSLLDSDRWLWSTAVPRDIEKLLGAASCGESVVLETDKFGNTPLHLCAKYGASTGVLETVATANLAQCKMQNNTGKVPLHLAAQRGFCELVRALFELDPETSMVKNKYGSTALECAKRNNQDISSVFLKSLMRERGFLVGVPSLLERSETWVDTTPSDVAALIKKNPFSIRTKDKNGYLPVHLALHWDAPTETLMYIVEENVSVMLDNKAAPIWKHVTPKQVDNLLKRFPNACTDALDEKTGRTILSVAVVNNAPVETIVHLIELNVQALLRGGEVGWKYATVEHAEALWETIVTPENTPTVQARAKALHLAVSHGATEDVVLRLVHFFPQACETKDPKTLQLPLHVATICRFAHLVPPLLAFYPAARFSRDRVGRTPSDYAKLDERCAGIAATLAYLAGESSVVNTEKWSYCLVDGVPEDETVVETSCSTARSAASTSRSTARSARPVLNTGRRLYFEAFECLRQSDMQIVVGTGPNRKFIDAHTKVLKLRSRYFKSKIRGRWAEMGREIHFKQMDPYFVSLIIRYCHEGRFSIDILRKSHLTVLEVAKELDVPGLIAICEAWGMGGGGTNLAIFRLQNNP